MNFFTKTTQCPFKSFSWMNSSKKNSICDAISRSNAPVCVTLALRTCFPFKWIPWGRFASSCRCHVQQSYHSQVCCVEFLHLCVCCTCSLRMHGCVSAWVGGCLQVCVCVCDGSTPASGLYVLQCWRIKQEKEAVKMDEAAQWRERGGENASTDVQPAGRRRRSHATLSKEIFSSQKTRSRVSSESDEFYHVLFSTCSNSTQKHSFV